MAPESSEITLTAIDRGAAPALGAVPDQDGTSFALCSVHADAVELCLFDEAGHEQTRQTMPGRHGDIFHAFVPACKPGQRYGYRVHGPYLPESGHRFNPNKLLLDPYARLISHSQVSGDAANGYIDGNPDDAAAFSTVDSAAAVPKSIVAAPRAVSAGKGPRRAWSEAVIYELNVRGYTMRHPDLSERERGRFRGLANGQIIKHLKSMGITTIELMPVHAFLDEAFLVARGLKNYWGYNSISFFAPQPAYADSASGMNPVDEFRMMVDALHDHGIEVILDVVYNHTAEGNRFGPTLSFRGIDNLSYYRTEAGNAGHYVNDTGCGNTINADSPMVRKLVVDSLNYWANDLGVDGFRFDLAPILGRSADGFHADHPLLGAIRQSPGLANSRLIAEPWDLGPGGYRLGHFPAPFAEWNDKYRDAVRRFWCGDSGQSAEFARRVHGSADIFEHQRRGPTAGINFVTSHDGFTLRDLVSYEIRHNHANGEENRDGHQHNYSRNHGIEGETDDEQILAVRRRQRLNLLATVLTSQGTPMLLAGDELGNGQMGNNNAYSQDNEIGWIDWAGLETDPEFVASVAKLIELRRSTPLLRQSVFVHGESRNADGQLNIDWLATDGRSLVDRDWTHLRALTLMHVDTRRRNNLPTDAVAVLMNTDDADLDFQLPATRDDREWRVAFSSCDKALLAGHCPWLITAKSIAIFVRSRR